MSVERTSRREFLRRSTEAGISITALGAFLSSGTGQARAVRRSQAPSMISIAINDSPWLPSFQQVVKIYRQETGNIVNLRVFPFAGLLSKELNAINVKSREFDILNLNEGWCATFYDAAFVTPLQHIDPHFRWPSGVIEYDYVCRWDHRTHFFSRSGTVYGLPINGNIQLFYYRQDLYDELGLTPPQTWEQVIAAAKKARAKYKDVYGYVVRGQGGGYSVTYNFLPVLRGFRGDVFANPPHDWTVTINNKEAQLAIDLYLELASYGPAQPQNIGQSEMIALMQSGKALQCHMVAAAYPNLDDQTQSSVVDKVNSTLIPKPSSGVHATTSGIWIMGIPTHITSAQQKAAYDFLIWLMGKNAQMKYAQAGGIVTRQDVYRSSLAHQQQFRYMKAMAASAPYIHLGIDYSFSPKLLQITDLRLNEIVGRLIKPKQGLDKMASEIAKVVTEAGLGKRSR
jgi:multiple sugar transport system substrate-binding protein